jgi:Concanavalin A-like lectin/glucanases superfamily
VIVALAALCTSAACSEETTPSVQSRVVGGWDMHPDQGVVKNRLGGADLTLTGGWTAVPGARGGAVRFDYSGGPSFATSTTNLTSGGDGTAPFAVAAYFKTDTVPTTSRYTPNIAQQGRFNGSSQWKMELWSRPTGTVARCRFKGTTAHHTVFEDPPTALDDGRWHEVVCWVARSSYGITVDGVTTSTTGTVGAIDGDQPLLVANRTKSSGVGDQFQGTLDCLAYAEGVPHPQVLVRSRVPC